MPVRSEPAVEVEDLTMRYGELTAVDRVSFAVTAGSVTALLGPNGAGKTSVIEALEGYRAPASGTLRVLGLDPFDGHRRLRGRVGVMLQEGGVHPGLRVAEVVRLFAAYYPDPVPPGELIERVGLGSRTRSTWRQLSGGERQRLSLALALIGRPEVVFLDEPTAGVDVEGRRLIREIVATAASAGATVLLASHELDEVERMAHHITIIDRGRVVASGTAESLLAGGEVPMVRFRAPAGIDVEGLGRAVGARVVELAPGQYELDGEGTPARVAALTAWMAEHDHKLGDLRAGRQRLEDVFDRLTGLRPERP